MNIPKKTPEQIKTEREELLLKCFGTKDPEQEIRFALIDEDDGSDVNLSSFTMAAAITELDNKQFDFPAGDFKLARKLIWAKSYICLLPIDEELEQLDLMIIDHMLIENAFHGLPLAWAELQKSQDDTFDVDLIG